MICYGNILNCVFLLIAIFSVKEISMHWYLYVVFYTEKRRSYRSYKYKPFTHYQSLQGIYIFCVCESMMIYCAAPCYIALALHCTALNYTALYRTVLHYTAMHLNYSGISQRRTRHKADTLYKAE